MYWFVRASYLLLGVDEFSSRLPSALAALGSVLVLFFVGRKLAGTNAGFFAAAALTVNSYFLWTGRVALLESVFLFFFLLALLFLLKALDKDRYFPMAGLFFGLAFLSKYTLLFALPAIGIYLIWRERLVFSSRRFWLGIFIFFLLALPVLVYNLEMLKTRGHFDVQFSYLFGQQHHDWDKLAARLGSSAIDVWEAPKILSDGFSWPYFGVFLAAFAAGFYLARKNQRIYLPSLILIFLLFFFTIVGAADRWLGVLSPFAALFIGLAWLRFWEKNTQAAAVLGILFAGLSLFYALNTNHFLKPIGGKNFYADFRAENLGYNQLDAELSWIMSGRQAEGPMRQAVNNWWFRGIEPQVIDFQEPVAGPPFRSLIVYDSRLDWFPVVWIFERWKFYHRFLIASSNEFNQIVSVQRDLDILTNLNLDSIFLITPKDSETGPLFDKFKARHIEPKIVYDNRGSEAFYIYQEQP